MTNIKKIRTKLLFSQESFAKKIGVSQASVSNWELKYTKPSVKTTGKIIKFAAKKGLYFTEKYIRG